MNDALPRFQGLVAASHTPFHPDGSLRLGVVEKQAEHLLTQSVRAVFVGGSTGESHSLSLDERRQLAARWADVTRATPLQLIVHAGANCLGDARELAAQAEQLGAAAVAALAPSYFKPNSVDTLAACCAEIASAAPATPFYFYDIPSMTGVHLPMPEFLEVAARIPNFAGLKFTNVDLVSFQRCRAADGGRYDILWGTDEMLLAALALGAEGAVGSTYNFAAAIYHRLREAFDGGDLATARREQLNSVTLVQVLARRGYMASAKALMTRQGVDVGPPRLPHLRLDSEQTRSLSAELEQLGY